CFLIQHGGRGHLPTGHAIDRIIDEDDTDVFTAVGGVKTFGNADGGKVSVPLIGKNDAVGKTAFDGGCHGRAASVERFNHIHVKVIISQYGTSRRRNADGDAANAHFIDHFGDKPVYDTVAAAGAI